MKKGLYPAGFTIVEIMVFLAVSGAILLSSFSLISGSQNKAQFSTAINDMQEIIDEVIDNVSSGYYPRPGNNGCVDDGSGSLDFSGSATDRGTNSNCAFLGRVIQFSENDDVLTIYNVAGLRQTTAPPKKEVGNMDEAKATLMPDPEIRALKNGIKVRSVTGISSIGAVGFFNGFGVSDGSTGTLESGSLQAEFIGVAGSSITNPANIGNLIKSNSFRSSYATNKNKPSNGIVICVDSGATNQSARITIGGQNKTSISTVNIQGGLC